MLLLLCFGTRARAANMVTVSSAEGVPGAEVMVSISLQNTDALSSLQVSIPLDESLTLVAGSAQAGSRCAGHAVSVGVSDGVLQAVVYSLSMATIAPGSGEVVSFRLKLGNEPGSITLQATKLVLTSGNGTAVGGSCEDGMVTIRCAKAQLGADEVDFGRVPIRSTYTREVAVSNVGNADLVVSSLDFTDVNVFSTTTQLPLTIAPGSTAALNVTFAPTERGTLERQLRIVSNSSTNIRAVRLKAQPYAVNELLIGDASGISDEEVTITMRMNNMDDISGYQADFTLPSSLQFVDGSFAVDADRRQDHVGVASVVDGTLRIVAYSPSGKPLLGNDGAIGSFRVKLVGKNSVRLTPVKTVLTSTINNKVENVVSDVFGGWIAIQYPSINTDGGINFGAVSVTEECKQTFTIRNWGSAPLTVSRIVFSNEHLSVAEQMPLEIPSWESRNVIVTYGSMEEAAFEAVMQIYSNDPEKRLHEVKVTGSRFAPNYMSLSIPDVYVDGELEVRLSLNTYDVITGLQFDMEYPSDLYEPYDGNVLTELRAAGMTVSSRQVSENIIRFVGYFLAGGGITAGEGGVLSILLKPVTASTPEGTYSVGIKDIMLGTAAMSNKYAGGNLESTFQMKQRQIIDQCIDLAEGWNWTSTNVATEVNAFLDPIKEKTSRLVSQTQELINDAEYGLVGGLQTMEVTAGYKLKMEEEATANLTGNFADPAATLVRMKKGWNWIGYVPMVALPVETALENLQATAGDKLVCKDGFAEYDGSAWVPADIVMEPGKGYMYKSAKDMTFKYSSATSAPAASRQRCQVSSDQQSPWQYDAYRYPDNMTIVAQVADVEEQVTVGAFCGDECRGIGRWVNDKLFIGVQGSAGSDEVISFRCYDSTTDEIVPVAETILFDGDSHGSLAAPIRLTLQGIATGIDANSVSGTFDVYSTSGLLVRRHVTSLHGLASGVYLVRGRKVVVR